MPAPSSVSKVLPMPSIKVSHRFIRFPQQLIRNFYHRIVRLFLTRVNLLLYFLKLNEHSHTSLAVELMCLGIPMQIKSIDGFTAHCEAKGVERDVSLFMMQDDELKVDDYVVVHVGYAIQKISQQEAQTAWELYDQMLEAGI